MFSYKCCSKLLMLENMTSSPKWPAYTEHLYNNQGEIPDAVFT